LDFLCGVVRSDDGFMIALPEQKSIPSCSVFSVSKFSEDLLRLSLGYNFATEFM